MNKGYAIQSENGVLFSSTFGGTEQDAWYFLNENSGPGGYGSETACREAGYTAVPVVLLTATDHAAALAELTKQREADRDIQRAALSQANAEIERLRAEKFSASCGTCEMTCADKDRRIAELEHSYTIERNAHNTADATMVALRAELATAKQQAGMYQTIATEQAVQLATARADVAANRDAALALEGLERLESINGKLYRLGSEWAVETQAAPGFTDVVCASDYLAAVNAAEQAGKEKS